MSSTRVAAVLVPLVGSMLACGGLPLGEPALIEVYGLDLAGLQTIEVEGGGILLPGARVDRITALLERSGWRRWWPSRDEALSEALHSRWSLVDEAGEHWLDLEDVSTDTGPGWLLTDLAEGPPVHAIDASGPLPVRMTRGREDLLVAAPPCVADEMGRTIELDFAANHTFTWTSSNGMDYSGGRWELAGDDVRLRGKLATSSGAKRPHTTVCRNAALLGDGTQLEVLACEAAFTFYCAGPPGPLAYVSDAGAGVPSVELVARALRGPPGSPGRIWAFVGGPAEQPGTSVVVRYRGDREQAERIAYRLHRDLVLEGVSVDKWPGAPAPFVVEVGGAVRTR